MATAKLSGDKLKRQNLLVLLSEYTRHYNNILTALDDYTTDKDLKKQVIRQLDGAYTIIRKAHKKSIEQKCQIHEHCNCNEWHN